MFSEFTLKNTDTLKQLLQHSITHTSHSALSLLFVHGVLTNIQCLKKGEGLTLFAFLTGRESE